MGDLKATAIRLRKEERLSLRQLSLKLNVPKSTVAKWVRPYPLHSEEVLSRMRAAGKLTHRHKRERGEESKYHKEFPSDRFSRAQKMRIAEAARLYRA